MQGILFRLCNRAAYALSFVIQFPHRRAARFLPVQKVRENTPGVGTLLRVFLKNKNGTKNREEPLDNKEESAGILADLERLSRSSPLVSLF